MLRNFTLFAIAATLVGCSANSDYTGSYVGGDETGLIKLTIVEADDQRVNATLSIAKLNYEAGKIDTTTGGLTGIRNGDAINLIAANGNGGSMSLLGKEGNLVWQIPDTGQSIELVQTDQAEYQKQLIALSQNLTANDVGLIPDE